MGDKKQNIGGIVKGSLFDFGKLANNYKPIFTVVIVIFIIIVSSHSADKKAYKINNLQKDVRELKSEFVSIRTQLMNSRMGSSMQGRVKSIGLQSSTTPPQILLVDKK